MKNEEKKHLPIGVFDSGLGGISVLRELVAELPEEKFIYYGDSANAPYGDKTGEEILSLSENAVDTLLSRGIKALVIACNTATSVAGKYLREKHPDLAIIGLEPALKPAIEHSNGGTIVVMATKATLLGEKFHVLLDKYSADKDVILIPASKIVGFVESGKFEGEEIDAYLKELFSPLKDKNVESVVLGCTHFPFVKKAIIKALGKDAIIYDGGKGAAAETRRRLEKENLLSDEHDGWVSIENSLKTDEMLELSHMLFEQ